jgi:hypothetical protein
MKFMKTNIPKTHVEKLVINLLMSKDKCFLKQKFVNFGLGGEVHENYTKKN